MKKTIIILFIAATTLLNSCSKDENYFFLGIDVQGFFKQDKVQVFIDNQELLNKILQTDLVVTVCNEGQIGITKNEGKHSIKVIVNNTLVKTEVFEMYNNHYIGINYNQLNDIWFTQSDKPFIYR